MFLLLVILRKTRFVLRNSGQNKFHYFAHIVLPTPHSSKTKYAPSELWD
jgi:ribosomal protein RSM22 (predicted rRNA methylase)